MKLLVTGASGLLGINLALEAMSAYEVVAVDRYPNAPGHQVAHRAHVVTMTDPAALKAVIEAERPHLIVPEVEAIATEVLAEIEAAGLAEVIPTARAAQLTMNREGIRRLAAETLGLPTSPYRFAESLPALLRFGICAHRKGFRDTALTYLRRVVEAAPSSAEAMEAQKYLVMLE